MVYAIFLCLSVSYCPMVPLGPDSNPNGLFASKAECERTIIEHFGAGAEKYGYRCLGREGWR